MTDADKIARARAVLLEQKVWVLTTYTGHNGLACRVYATKASVEAALDAAIVGDWQWFDWYDTEGGKPPPMPDTPAERLRATEDYGTNLEWEIDYLTILP